MKTPDQHSITVGTKSMEAMWAKLAESSREETPPPGSMCAREFGEKFNIPLEATTHRLARMHRAGKITATPVRRFVNGRLRTIIYYTPKA